MVVPAAEDARHRSRWTDLEEELLTALEESLLPDEAANIEACDAWLIAARRADMRA